MQVLNLKGCLRELLKGGGRLGEKGHGDGGQESHVGDSDASLLTLR